jgi:hypothetical protein
MPEQAEIAKGTLELVVEFSGKPRKALRQATVNLDSKATRKMARGLPIILVSIVANCPLGRGQRRPRAPEEKALAKVRLRD